jgi:hypothetical protein
MLHSMLQCAFNPICLHYISRDQHEAHKLTNYILNPSPEPSRQSPGAPGKDCACCEAVFPGYFQLENWFLVVELVTDPGTDKFQAASLKRINKYNTYN